MKLTNTFKITWWIVLLLILSSILGFRLINIIDGKATNFDIVLFIIFIALMLAPIFAEVELFGVKLKQEIEELKDSINIKFGDLKNEIRNSQNQTFNATFQGFGPPPPDNKIPELESEIERIIKDKIGNLTSENSDSINNTDVPQNNIEMFKVRFNIEKELRRIWEDRFFATDSSLRHLPVTRIMSELEKRNIIENNLTGILREILSICNYAIHGEKVSPNQLEFVKSNGGEIIEILKNTR